MQRLRICIFTETYAPEIGGGETQARLLAEGLLASGHTVIIVTRRSNRSSRPVEQIGGLRIFRLPPAGRGQLKKWGLVCSSVPWLIALAPRYDLIFVSGFRIVGISAVLISRLMRKRCVLKADSQGEMSGEFFKVGLRRRGLSTAVWPFRLFLFLRNRILSKADAFTAISADVAEELRAVGLPSHQIHRIPNSVDTTRFVPASPEQKRLFRQKLGVPQDAPLVVYTGRLVSYKGLPLLLRVWQALSQKHNQARLMLVGSGGLDIHNCEDQLRTYVETTGLTSSVRFTGGVSNVELYLQAADIFAFPTENDAFPSSLIEAMACALPVVTTPVGAIRSIIVDQENGLIVPPADPQRLLQALDALISNRALASRLGWAGWKTIQENYSASTVTGRYLSLFDHAVNLPIV